MTLKHARKLSCVVARDSLFRTFSRVSDYFHLSTLRYNLLEKS